MATTASTPSQRADARRNRARLVEAARAVFAREGIDAQMSAVAAEAGVGTGTVYRHFPTKEALMAELVSDRFRLFATHAAEAAASSDSAWEALRTSLRRNLEAMVGDTGTQHLLARKSGPGWDLVAPARDELVATLAPLVDDAQAAGDLRADFRTEDLGMLMCGICASMSSPEGGDWRRHLGYVLDGLKAR